MDHYQQSYHPAEHRKAAQSCNPTPSGSLKEISVLNDAPSDITSGTAMSNNVNGHGQLGDRAVQSPPGWRFALLSLGICLGLFLAMLDTSIVATSIYSIAAEFDELEAINWVALAYTLTYLSFAVLFARISDVVGRKAAFLAAFFIFIAFSLGCGFAQNLTQLIACRALQGLGGSGLYSIAIIIFPEVANARQKQFIAGIIGVVITMSGVLGPVLGGVLTHYASWRWVFWINGPIGTVSALAFWICWPEKQHAPDIERRQWRHLDYVGSFLIIASSVLICFAFQNGAIDPTQWGRAVFIATFIVGIFCVVALGAWEIYIERHWKGKLAAAMPMKLMRNRVYVCGVLNTMLLGFPYLLSIYTFPIRFQVVHGKSALDAGLMLLPMLAATASGSMLTGLINRDKNRLFETLLAACLLMLLGCALATTATPSQAIEAKILGFLVFIGLGFGLSASASTMLGVAEAPIREHAPAQGIIAQLRIFGGSIGIAASSAILGRKTRDQLTGILLPEQLSDLAAQLRHLTPAQHAAVRATYTDALKQDMIVCCAILAAACLCTLGVYQKGRVSIEERQRQHVVDEQDRRRGRGPEDLPLADRAPGSDSNGAPARGFGESAQV